MKRLNVLAEGYTEQSFAEKLLPSYLNPPCQQIFSRCVETSRNKKKGRVYRGGLLSYAKVKADLVRWLKECSNSDVFFTTMFDYYALPSDFPGMENAQRKNDVYEKIQVLEDAFAEDVNDRRFIPYIQLHEFETLIFVKPQELEWSYLGKDSAIRNLSKVLDDFENCPELINNGLETAPSKRILREIPEYDKASAGVDTVELIGADLIKESCPHFSAWINKLSAVLGS